MNLPYSLEQSSNYSAHQRPAGEKASAKLSQEQKGPRLNRYYETLKPYYKLKEPIADDKTLVFESRFESANLRKVVKINDFEYDLYLKNDYGTNGFTQWFFFRVMNTRKDKTYRINIVNYMKPDSNYNQGMRPLIYSVKDAEENQIGWQREGQNISYYQGARRKKQYNQQGSGVLGSVTSASTATSIPGGGPPASTSGYGPVYYALSFEIQFKCKYYRLYLSFLRCLTLNAVTRHATRMWACPPLHARLCDTIVAAQTTMTPYFSPTATLSPTAISAPLSTRYALSRTKTRYERPCSASRSPATTMTC